MALLDFLLCFFFGFLGIHKFRQKKIILGIAYIFTFGLFGIGWFLDSICLFGAVIGASEDGSEENSTPAQIIAWILFALFVLATIGALPSPQALLPFAIAALLLPIYKWQKIVKKPLNGRLRIVGILLLLLAIGMINIDTPIPSELPTDITEYEESTIETTETTHPDDTTAEITTIATVGTTTTTAETTITTTTTTAATTTTTAATTTTTAVTTTTAATTTTTVVTTTVHTHSWSEPTCTEPRTCTSCGITDGTARGHSWNEATPTSPKTCNYCGATEGTALDIPGKANYHGHVYTGGDRSEKYHYEAECAGKYSHEISWDEVNRRGLGPCKTCVLK